MADEFVVTFVQRTLIVGVIAERVVELIKDQSAQLRGDLNPSAPTASDANRIAKVRLIAVTVSIIIAYLTDQLLDPVIPLVNGNDVGAIMMSTSTLPAGPRAFPDHIA